MLELRSISKEYVVGEFRQKALNDINLKFRRCEFVSILGASGSGKTTMLNIIGGLDKYTSGDLIINNKSTKMYKDRDWDTYRNHSIGFVFQSYNLIPHQTALSNVELALTLSGISSDEARKRAKEVLIKVGLGEHINKKPSQMSGGQMQRIAIARALVNDPDILLADEPTGALDTDTSVQIMDLLKEIAKDKLVIMVTHNAELAEEYSTRIVKISDGKLIGDSNPYEEEDNIDSLDKNPKKTHMSFITALKLSLNNLLTKKGRTLLTSFAGSIGIIGIALIMSLSNGVQKYINNIEKETLSSYPITVEEQSFDMSSMMSAMMSKNNNKEEHEKDKIYSDNILANIVDNMTSQMNTNNLEAFKKYLDNSDEIDEYTSDIQYSYNLDLNIYSTNTDNGILKVNPSPILEDIGYIDTSNQLFDNNNSKYNMWKELINNKEALNSQYEILKGRLPKKYNEVVLIVNKDNEISDYTLYTLGIKDRTEVKDLLKRIMQGEKFESNSTSYTYDEFLNLKFKLVLNSDYFEKESNIWVDKSNDTDYMKELIENSEDIKIVGIIKAKDDATINNSHGEIGYTKELTEYVINKINNSKIVSEQLSNKYINVFTGLPFIKLGDNFDINSLTEKQKEYLSTLSQEEINKLIATYLQAGDATYEDNLKKLGVVDLNKPSTINLYPKSFKDKKNISNFISEYNKSVDENDTINYTDYIGLMMQSVNDIVNIISYILMSFVSISLIVSSIMIGIITYISVLERTKEIGILRSIGASKKDISRVFNAETVIIGLVSGILGIGITIIFNIPINIIIKHITDVSGISKLPFIGATTLIIISMILTVVAGVIPAKIASRKDPVEALRTE